MATIGADEGNPYLGSPDEFDEHRTPGLLQVAAMELELTEELGRDVDDLSRHFQDTVRRTSAETYVA